MVLSHPTKVERMYLSIRQVKFSIKFLRLVEMVFKITLQNLTNLMLIAASYVEKLIDVVVIINAAILFFCYSLS